ncbi:winged helix-turn-helix transcriptional regulator [Flavitalea flava]
MAKKTEPAPTCSIDYAFRHIGGKYKGRIIAYIHLFGNGVLRYGQLRKQIQGITPKMLTQTLRELEDDHLIFRKVYHEVPPRVEYSLTASAKELIPFILHLKQWAEAQMEKEKIAILYDTVCSVENE